MLNGEDFHYNIMWWDHDEPVNCPLFVSFLLSLLLTLPFRFSSDKIGLLIEYQRQRLDIDRGFPFLF